MHLLRPRATGVTYGHHYRLVFFFGLLKSLRTPRMPVYWIIGVAPEEGGLFIEKTVRLARRGQRSAFPLHRQILELPFNHRRFAATGTRQRSSNSGRGRRQ